MREYINMDIIKSIRDVNNLSESVVTIGKFDGLHKGHDALIEKAVNSSKKIHTKSILLRKFTLPNPHKYYISLLM